MPDRKRTMTYPADFQLDAPVEVANWRPLVHWLLVIPHTLIAGVLNQVASVLALVSWFIIVFTGALPEGIARFQCMVIRYETRIYSYVFWLRESYPVFEYEMTASDPGGDPVRVDLVPQLENRNRVTVGFRLLLVIPIAIFVAVLAIAVWLVVLVGFFAVLFTGRWPEGLRRFVVNFGRLVMRVNTYARLLVDDYPPFALEDTVTSDTGI